MLRTVLYRIVWFSSVVFVLGGCASSGGQKTESVASLKSGSSKIIVYRESNSIAMFAAPSVLVNGADIGKLSNGSYIETSVESGSYTITFAGNFFNWPWPVQSVQIEASPNETSYVQLAIYDVGGKFTVQERSKDDASTVIEKLKR